LLFPDLSISSLQSAKTEKKICALLISANAPIVDFVPFIFPFEFVFQCLTAESSIPEILPPGRHKRCPYKNSMNPIDLFIIYLACGAPFGVYYFFQNREPVKSKLFWCKTFLNFLFWMPFAFILLRQNKSFKILSLFGSDKFELKNAEQEANIHMTVKQIEKVFLESRLEISVYEFRETIERYVGLTIAGQTNAAEISGTEFSAQTEFFRVTRAKNIELGAICLNRRNRKRLFRHQTEARKDFLNLINQLLEFNSDKKKLERSAIELVRILKDLEARKELEEMFVRALQTGNRFSVSETEKDLWKPEVPKLSPVKKISYQLPAMKATLNLRKKD